MTTTARAAAMNYLARRDHSKLELHRKLKQKGFAQPEIDEALTTLQQKGLFNESRFVEIYAHHRRQKGYGPLRIQAELTTRGIPEDVIEHHLNMADNAWFADAHRVWQKRFKGHLPRDVKTRAAQMRFLQYRGFTATQINNIFDSSDIT